MADPTDSTSDDGSTKTVVGNGLKVALVAGGILGAGFLFWRLAYGGEKSEEKSEAEAQAAPATAAAVAPIASCSCGGAPPPTSLEGISADTIVRVGDRWMTLGELRSEVRRIAA